MKRKTPKSYIKYSPVGRLIEKAIIKDEMTRTDFAMELGVDYTKFYRIITGRQPLDFEVAFRLECLFNLDAVELLTTDAKYHISIMRLNETIN